MLMSTDTNRAEHEIRDICRQWPINALPATEDELIKWKLKDRQAMNVNCQEEEEDLVIMPS